MLRTIENLRSYKIQATDGEIGQVDDFYFDDKDWTIRYLVVDIGHWLKGQKVLLAPETLEPPVGVSNQLPVKLTKREVEDSPTIDAHKPYIHQAVAGETSAGGWPPIGRLGGGLFDEQGIGMRPDSLVETIRAKQQQAKTSPSPAHEDPHLRSVTEVLGYHIQARDGEIGHVEDFIVHEDTWTIHYMLVDTRNWLPGKKVVVSPSWIETINWDEAKVRVDLSRDTIQNSPEYNPTVLTGSK